jgi:hypothetical protein
MIGLLTPGHYTGIPDTSCAYFDLPYSNVTSDNVIYLHIFTQRSKVGALEASLRMVFTKTSKNKKLKTINAFFKLN